MGSTWVIYETEQEMVSISVSRTMGRGGGLVKVQSLSTNDKICYQNAKCHSDRNGSSKIPECHCLHSGAQYHIRRKCEHGGQKVSDGSDDRAPHPQENLYGRFVKQRA